MADSLAERFVRLKYGLLYPYIRRKDAGYIANVLSEYFAFSLADCRSKLPNFTEVERCASALLVALDESPDVDKVRLAELKQAIGATASEPNSSALLQGPDPMSAKIWLQSYMRQLFQVEKAVLEMQDYPALLARAPFLLERFRTVADPKVDFLKRQYDQDLAPEKLSKLWDTWLNPLTPPVEKEAQKPWLRGKLVSLLNDVHWWYAQSQVREELFLGQQIAVISTFLVASGVLLAAFAWGCGDCNNKVTVAVMFFGLLGAFTSVLRRMRSDAEQHGGGAESSYKELTALAYGKIGITMSLFFGLVFSLVLMLIFYGNLPKAVFSDMATSIFPSLPLTWPSGESCTSCVFGMKSVPGQGREFGKLLLWSFLAGFAEQLVPDALDRLTKAANSKKP